MNNQLKKTNYIPILIALGFSCLMFAFLALPHSQYSLLGEMTVLNGSNIDSQGNLIPLNYFTVLPAIFTLFLIISLSVVVLLCLVGLLMNYFYNFHFVSKTVLIFASLSSALEFTYYFIGIRGTFADGTKVTSWGNLVSVILNVIYLVALYVTYFRFVEKPYQEIKVIAYKKAKVFEAREKEEEKKTTQAEEVVKDNVSQMQKMILSMLSEGKITPEEADKLLNELNNKEK